MTVSLVVSSLRSNGGVAPPHRAVDLAGIGPFTFRIARCGSFCEVAPHLGPPLARNVRAIVNRDLVRNPSLWVAVIRWITPFNIHCPSTPLGAEITTLLQLAVLKSYDDPWKVASRERSPVSFTQLERRSMGVDEGHQLTAFR